MKIKKIKTEILEKTKNLVRLRTQIKKVQQDTLGFYIPCIVKDDFSYGTIVEVTIKKVKR